MNKLEDIDVKYWELLFTSDELGKKNDMDYAARCPICGDSKKRKNLKRCHLYTKNDIDYSIVHCFNCGWKGNMYKLLELVNPYLYNAYKNEKRTQSLNSLKKSYVKKEKEFKINTDFINANKLNKSKPPILFKLPDEIKNIKKNDEYYNYLKSRKISDNYIKMFKCVNGTILYNNQRIELKKYIILPLYYDNELIYGFQARSITSKRFFTFIPFENHGFKVWNWFNVNLNEPIYVFESYFDAMSSGLKNVIAQLGATLSENIKKEIKNDLIFVLDNQNIDETAKRELLKYCNEGYKVMIWPKNIKFKDFNEILCAGASSEKISKFIKKNINEDITAKVMLTM